MDEMSTLWQPIPLPPDPYLPILLTDCWRLSLSLRRQKEGEVVRKRQKAEGRGQKEGWGKAKG
jgi:hypothetical protein